MNIPAFLTEKLTAQVGEETARRIFAGFEAKRTRAFRRSACRGAGTR